MALADDIKRLLVIGNSVTVSITYNPGTDYTGIVEKIEDGEFELSGEIINQYEHFSNISADPIYRMHRFDIKDIASINAS